MEKTSFNLEYVKQICLSKNIEYLEKEYKNSIVKNDVKCLICNHEWKVCFHYIKNKKQGCPRCCGHLKISDTIAKTRYETFNVECLEAFKGRLINHKFKCKKCEFIWEAKPANIFAKKGCIKCNRIVGNNKTKSDINKIIKNLKNKNILFCDNEYINCRYKHNVKCMLCNYAWQACYNNLMSQASGCINCTRYPNEKLTGQFLRTIFKNCSVEFKTIKDSTLSFQKSLRVDFYIKYKNLEIIVEYNGLQHYAPVNFSGDNIRSIKNFERQQKRDEWLRQYCKENNIVLIEIDGRLYKGNSISDYLTLRLGPYLYE